MPTSAASSADRDGIPQRHRAGAIATVNGKQVVLGNARLMASEGIDTSAVAAQQQALANGGRTAVMFAVDGKIAGVIALADAARDTTKSSDRRAA